VSKSYIMDLNKVYSFEIVSNRIYFDFK